MAELDLPAGPAKLLEAVRGPLGHHLGGEHHMHLGGGTALAMRWQHRHSTDVDLFVDPAAYARLFEAEQQFGADLDRQTDSARHIAIEPGFARIVLADGGEVSLSPSLSLTAVPLSTDTVRGTRVPLETTAEILAKKLRYYMIQNVQIVPRVLYDIAFARRRDPDALQTALSTLNEDHIHDIDAELSYLRPGWIERHHESLIAPISRTDAENAVGLVRSVLQQHLRSRTARGERGFTWDR